MCKSVFQIVIGLVVCLSVSTYAATYDGGSGTAGDPYRIATPAHWQTLMATSADWSKYFVLTADINLSGVTITPVGNATTKFAGSFNGAGRVISNLSYSSTTAAYVGLFGYTASVAVIQNLSVQNVTISASSVTGALIGANYGTVQSCSVTGSVSGVFDLGGLAGRNSGTISFCFADVSVSGTDYTVGGLVGYNPGSISNCYATGTVTGNKDIGGLVGFYDGLQLSNCFATGAVTGNIEVGGLVGYQYHPATACFWDIETSGLVNGVGFGNSTGIVGKTTAQMQTESTFTAAGWDFSAGDGDAADWKIQGTAYPRLAWESYTSGYGTSANPYQIKTVADWQTLMSTSAHWNKYFILTNDINLDGITLTRVGNDSVFFTGVFDGNRHTISNVVMNLPGNASVGLFGIVGSGGQIKNLGVENVNIRAFGMIGGMVGVVFESTVTSCYASGTVVGDYSDAGGLVGLNRGTITSCYAACAVTCDENTGGLAGSNNGTITSCYSTGAVTGESTFGGLVGINSNSIASSFWDTETSGQSNGVGYGDSDGIVGKTTVQMQTLSTFADAGWDFWAGDDPADWLMPADGYPRLVWENFCGDAAHPYPPGDSNYDCHVDLNDFAILAANWLACTAPACD